MKTTKTGQIQAETKRNTQGTGGYVRGGGHANFFLMLVKWRKSGVF